MLEAPVLAPAPLAPDDLPHYATPKVARDHHVEVAKALYSVPGNLIGRHLDARADKDLVKLDLRGQLVKVHPRQPAGGRSTDPADLPKGTEVYALRDLEREEHGGGPRTRRRCLRGRAARPPAALDQDAPGLRVVEPGQEVGARSRGAGRARAAEAEAYSVSLIGRMLQRGTEGRAEPAPIQGRLLSARFARPDGDFAVLPVRREDPEPAVDLDRGSEATTAGASS